MPFFNFKIMSQIAISNAEYVEVLNASTPSQKLAFPDLPNLRGKSIIGLEAYTASEQSKSKDQNNVITQALLKSVSVTLYFNGGEFIVVPLVSLYRLNGATYTIYGDIPMLNGQVINWPKSYMFINDSTLVSSFANLSFLFNVYYR